MYKIWGVFLLMKYPTNISKFRGSKIGEKIGRVVTILLL